MESKLKTPTQQELVNDWLRFTVERFQAAMDKAGVGTQRRALYNSFAVSSVSGGNGDVSLALLKFNMYGRYVDMGVGRGVPIGSQKVNADFAKHRFKDGKLRKYGRKPKKWYSKTFAGQTKKLVELMAEHYGITAIQALENSLPGEVNIIV